MMLTQVIFALLCIIFVQLKASPLPENTKLLGSSKQKRSADCRPISSRITPVQKLNIVANELQNCGQTDTEFKERKIISREPLRYSKLTFLSQFNNVTAVTWKARSFKQFDAARNTANIP